MIGFKRNILRVQPDILPAGSIQICDVWIDDEPYSNFDASGLTIKLPATKERVRVKVLIEPVETNKTSEEDLLAIAQLVEQEAS